MQVLLVLWSIITLVQSLLGIGTAYRLTKSSFDNGVALFVLIILMNLVAFIPGLGIFVWFKTLDTDVDYIGYGVPKRPKWMPPQKHWQADAPEAPKQEQDAGVWQNPYK